LLTSCEQDQDGTPEDGQRNCPKHVEFYFKNEFEKLVHLVGFITRIYHDARSAESQGRVFLSVLSTETSAHEIQTPDNHPENKKKTNIHSTEKV